MRVPLDFSSMLLPVERKRKDILDLSYEDFNAWYMAIGTTPPSEEYYHAMRDMRDDALMAQRSA